MLAPIARWQDVYNSLVVRMRALEKQRLEVDSRRRTVAGLSARVDGQRSKLGVGGTKAEQKREKLERTIKLLQHKEGKLSGEGPSSPGKEQRWEGMPPGLSTTQRVPHPEPALLPLQCRCRRTRSRRRCCTAT